MAMLSHRIFRDVCWRADLFEKRLAIMNDQALLHSEHLGPVTEAGSYGDS